MDSRIVVATSAPAPHLSVKHRPWLWPTALLNRLTSPVPPGLSLANFIFQRILRVNGNVPWSVHYTSQVIIGKGLTIGRNVWKSFALSGSCYVQGGNGVVIGEDTIFAPGTKIISANHKRKLLSEWVENRPLVIGARCWLGANSVVLPGVHIGDDVIIGAGSVVTHDIASWTVVGGVPARTLKTE